MEKIDFNKLKPILEANDVAFAGVFGSYARGEEKPESDVDILVKFKKTPGFFGFFGLQRHLAETLKKRVDLVTEAALSPYIKDYVLQDLRPIYGTR